MWKFLQLNTYCGNANTFVKIVFICNLQIRDQVSDRLAGLGRVQFWKDALEQIYKVSI